VLAALVIVYAADLRPLEVPALVLALVLAAASSVSYVLSAVTTLRAAGARAD
jgi:hypothetical protein